MVQASETADKLDKLEAESIYIAELDLGLLRKHREREIMGDKFRRPEKYGILTEKRCI